MAALMPKYLAQGMSEWRARCAAFAEADALLDTGAKARRIDRRVADRRRYDQASDDVRYCLNYDRRKGGDRRRSEGVGKVPKQKAPAGMHVRGAYVSDARFGW